MEKSESRSDSEQNPQANWATVADMVSAEGTPPQKSQKPEKKPPRSFKPPLRDSEYIEKVVTINRCTKVTKGGKRLAFSALVVVGDGKGHVGYGLGKAGEVAAAIKKSLITAKKSMITVPLNGLTITHQINGECGSAVVMLKPAAEGTGVIAAGPVRAVCDAAGIRNILTKCHRSNNPINVVKATMNGLHNLKSATTKKIENVQTETTNAAQ